MRTIAVWYLNDENICQTKTRFINNNLLHFKKNIFMIYLMPALNISLRRIFFETKTIYSSNKIRYCYINHFLLVLH